MFGTRKPLRRTIWIVSGCLLQVDVTGRPVTDRVGGSTRTPRLSVREAGRPSRHQRLAIFQSDTSTPCPLALSVLPVPPLKGVEQPVEGR